MTGVLAGYLRGRVVSRTLALTAFLTGIMQMLDLLDATTDILDRRLGVQGIVYYATLRLPSEIMLALPFATLLGAMWAFHELARNHEMVPVRASGVSLRQVLLYMVPVALGVALVHLALAQALVPVSETKLATWWEATAPPEESTESTWVRTSDGPVSFAAATPDGRRLSGLTLYLRDENHLLSRRLSAQSAEWHGGAWRLQAIEELRVVDGRVSRSSEDARVWQTNLRPGDVRRVDLAHPTLSSIMLADIIVGERVGTQPISYYQTALYRSLVAPLVPFIMLLLALPTARGLPRRDDGGRDLLVALGLGLAFQLCDGFLAALGTSGRIPTAWAAFLAPALFTAGGLALVSRCERT